MTKRALGSAGLIILLGLLWTVTFTVSESETAIVVRLGDPRRHVDEAGLHFKLPIDTVWRIDQKIRMLDVEEEEFLTADKKNLLVRASVAWSVEDPLRFLQSASGGVEQVEARLADLVQTQLGNVLGAHTFGELISTGSDAPPFDSIDEAIAERAARDASETYGVEIRMARITRLTFPDQNRRAVFNRMEAERQKIAQEIRSKGMESAERIRSDADLAAAKLITEARYEAAKLRGAGEAEATRIYNEAYSRDPQLFELLRTLEALETTFGPDDTFVIPSDSKLLDVLLDIEATGLLGPRVEPPAVEPVKPGEPGEPGAPLPADESNPEAQDSAPGSPTESPE